MAEQVQEGGNADREHPSSTQTEAEEEESSGTAEQEESSRGTAKYATLQEAVLAGDRAAIREMMAERDSVLKRKREEEEEERESKRRRIEEEEKDIEPYSDRYWARYAFMRGLSPSSLKCSPLVSLLLHPFLFT